MAEVEKPQTSSTGVGHAEESREDHALAVVGRRTAGKLERLDVVGTSLCITPHGLSALLDSCPRLIELRVHRCDSKKMPPDIVQVLAQHQSAVASRLQILTLCGMRRLTDATIAEHFSRFTNLRSLSLEACTQITANGLSTIAISCPKLAAVYLKVQSW